MKSIRRVGQRFLSALIKAVRGRQECLPHAIALCALSFAAPLRAQPPIPAPLLDVGIDQHLNEQLPLDLAFRDEQGRAVKLGDYFGSRPVVLILAYYQCPMLCTQVLNGITRTASAMPWPAGEKYHIVVVSIDPTETPGLAAAKKRSYQQLYAYRNAADGWSFLTGDEPQIERLAAAVGYRYRYDPKSKQYAHGSGIMIATPEGKLSRYFYGIDYPTRDLRLALVEASEGKIGSPVDRFLLLCFHYDPLTGRYGVAIMNVIRALGVATVAVLGAFIAMSLRRERKSRIPDLKSSIPNL
ncbi:MAG TPA: SCO family protein [Pirellulales bacterium]|jgi:protein SCO1/2|nr:SCO family protein [Pirellulales bacterium]